MKYLLVLLVVGVGLWLLIGRGKRARRRFDAAAPKADAVVQSRMAACAHCGLHLPESDVLFDAQGRPYCGDDHRRLGAR